MFGWGVEEAIATYRKAADDKKLLGTLLLFGATPEITHHYKIAGDTVFAYDEKGAEIVRVPLKEPIHVRKAYDETREVYRTNIT